MRRYFFVGTNYEKIIHDNLSRFFAQLSDDAEKSLGAEKRGGSYYFRAFGEDCCLCPKMVSLSGKPADEPRGLLISLYALHANAEPMQTEPFKSFKDFPDSMPYQNAFSVNSEKVLVPHVLLIKEKQPRIKKSFDGRDGLPGLTGDFCFILYPLPKIALYYIFYLPDEEFPASATCLFSANALSFMPLDGLADVAEYTSREIVQLVLK
ncbi:MAG: DUF3786 domain-containing protein [Deltaproteobacteria bacterium]|nr:DUF3786 domain-containing protein [Deltaproteobacteria bacterium]